MPLTFLRNSLNELGSFEVIRLPNGKFVDEDVGE
jgi:hypothetical protein